ncbi:MAG: calcium-binding protein, partial [Candidatus Puniceispirillaceae bacterium]
TALPTISSVTLEYNDGGTWKEIISDSLVVSGNQIKLASVGKITRANINKLRFSPDADYQAPPNGGKASFGFTLHDRTTGSADKTGNLFTLTVNQRPTVTSILSQIVTASIAYSLDFSTYFTDLDDTTLSGSWGLTVSGAGNTLPTGLSLHTSGNDKGKITGTGTSTSYGKYALTASYTDAANSAVTTSTSFDLFYLEAGTANADGTRTTPLSKQFYNALAGDDVIAGSVAQDVILGGSGDDFILSGGGADILDGGTGQDTLSFAGITAAITFSLVGTRDQGGYLTASGGSTARVRGFEHIIGGSGADILTGDDKPNIIEGGPGADTLRGGGGVDTVSYAHASSGVNVRLNSQVNNFSGDAAGDNLGGFENILGSAYDDTLRGDLFINGIDGGAGSDMADYVYLTDSDQDVKVNLASTTRYSVNAKGIWVETNSGTYVSVSIDKADNSGRDINDVDYLSNIENIRGGAGSDVLGGNAFANILEGMGGNDTLQGRAGHDRLFGTAGNDLLEGGADGDWLDGGTGTDTASYAHSTTAVKVNLTEKLIHGDWAESRLSTWQTASNSRIFGTFNQTTDSFVLTNITDTSYTPNYDEFLLGNFVADGSPNGKIEDNHANLSLTTVERGGVDVTAIWFFARTTDLGGGEAEHDYLAGIENLIGSAFNDTLTGTDLANLIEGRNGNDMINGGKGNDDLRGGGGNDTLTAGEGADILSGGAGADTLKAGDPSKGRDILTGGAGNDIFEIVGYAPDDPNRSQGDITVSDYQEARAVIITDFTSGDQIQVPSGVTRVLFINNSHPATGRSTADGNDASTFDTMIFNYKVAGTNRTELIAILEDYTTALTAADFLGSITVSSESGL